MVSLASFRNAYRGLRAVVSRERNARIHVAFAIIAIIAAVWLRVPFGQAALVMTTIGLVFFAEIMNTAFERTLDLLAYDNNQVVKLVKDMAAGGVLVTAATAVLVAACIFGPPIYRLVLG
mgnify:FL=1